MANFMCKNADCGKALMKAEVIVGNNTIHIRCRFCNVVSLYTSEDSVDA